MVQKSGEKTTWDLKNLGCAKVDSIVENLLSSVQGGLQEANFLPPVTLKRRKTTLSLITWV